MASEEMNWDDGDLSPSSEKATSTPCKNTTGIENNKDEDEEKNTVRTEPPRRASARSSSTAIIAVTTSFTPPKATSYYKKMSPPKRLSYSSAIKMTMDIDRNSIPPESAVDVAAYHHDKHDNNKIDELHPNRRVFNLV
jgi:hypothetical protein